MGAFLQYGIVYLIECRASGKSYVGQTTQRLSKRIAQHRVSQFPLGHAMRKYGNDSFLVTVLDRCSSRAGLDAAERAWIADVGTVAPGGYNIKGGGLSAPHSESTKAKIRAAKLGKDLSHAAHAAQKEYLNTRVFSAETRAKLGAAAKGRVYSMEARERMGAHQRGKKLSVEHRAKLAAASTGRPCSEATREKRRVAMQAFFANKKAGAL